MKPVHVDGGITECRVAGGKHWHAEVQFLGYEPVVSRACATEEDAQQALEFARRVVEALTVAIGGRSVFAEGTDTVQ